MEQGDGDEAIPDMGGPIAVPPSVSSVSAAEPSVESEAGPGSGGGKGPKDGLTVQTTPAKVESAGSRSSLLAAATPTTLSFARVVASLGKEEPTLPRPTYPFNLSVKPSPPTNTIRPGPGSPARGRGRPRKRPKSDSVPPLALTKTRRGVPLPSPSSARAASILTAAFAKGHGIAEPSDTASVVSEIVSETFDVPNTDIFHRAANSTVKPEPESVLPPGYYDNPATRSPSPSSSSVTFTTSMAEPQMSPSLSAPNSREVSPRRGPGRPRKKRKTVKTEAAPGAVPRRRGRPPGSTKSPDPSKGRASAKNRLAGKTTRMASRGPSRAASPNLPDPLGQLTGLTVNGMLAPPRSSLIAEFDPLASTAMEVLPAPGPALTVPSSIEQRGDGLVEPTPPLQPRGRPAAAAPMPFSTTKKSVTKAYKYKGKGSAKSERKVVIRNGEPCRGWNKQRQAPCRNFAMKEFIGPQPLYCAEHIDQDPTSLYRKCRHVPERPRTPPPGIKPGSKAAFAHLSKEERKIERERIKPCKEVVLKEFDVCFKHFDEILSVNSIPESELGTYIPAKYARVCELLESTQREARDNKKTHPEISERKLKVIPKYTAMKATMETLAAIRNISLS